MRAATDEQRLRDDQRERDLQREACAPSFFCLDFDFTIELRQVGLDHIQTNSASCQLGFARSRCESRMEENIEQFALTQFSGPLRIEEPVLDRCLAHSIKI